MKILTREQAEQIVNSRPQGMSETDAIRDIVNRGYVVEGLNEPEKPRGFIKSVIQEGLEGPARLAATGLDVAEGLYSIGKVAAKSAAAPFSEAITIKDTLRQGSEELKEINRGKTRDFGFFGEEVRPIGLSKDEERLKGIRMYADAAGVGAETASLGMPFAAKAGLGFWKQSLNAMKSAPALFFGLGTGLQEYAETGSPVKGGVTGAVDVVGSGLGFGVLNKGGQFVSKFGGRFLADKLNRTIGEGFKNVMAPAYTTMRDGLSRRNITDDVILSESLKDTYSAYQGSFDETLYRNTQNVLNDTRVAYSRDPDVVTTELSRQIGRDVDAFYKTAERTYKSADNTGFEWNDLGRLADEYTPTKKEITIEDIIKQSPEFEGAIRNRVKAGQTLDELAENFGVTSAPSSKFDMFVGDIFKTLNKGNLKASEVLDQAYQLVGIGSC